MNDKLKPKTAPTMPRPQHTPQRPSVPVYDSVHSNNRRNDTTVQQTQPAPPPPKR